jgi:hypothetical protein
MANNPFSLEMTRSMQTLVSSLPLKKGGQGGFPPHRIAKSPSIPLFQRGKQSLRSVTKHLTRRITFVVALVVFLTAPSFLQAQSLPTGEKRIIETLIEVVGGVEEG